MPCCGLGLCQGKAADRYDSRSPSAGSFPPPADFGRITRPSGSCVSTVGLLVEAAQQCGKLDELTADLEPLAKEKVENADTFRLLLCLRRAAAASEAGITERLSEIASRAKSKPDPLGQVYYDDEGNRGAASVRWSDILVARAAAASDRTAELGERMLKLLFQEASQRNDMQATALIDGALFAIKYCGKAVGLLPRSRPASNIGGANGSGRFG